MGKTKKTKTAVNLEKPMGKMPSFLGNCATGWLGL